ncbi:hypothetical protein HCN44_011467 [Aphidius gifuensis]|uniref:Uncharacterized protein n=1 Tax=Aphidius gifuensis TaxID=684658 RepID=A0A834XVF9_APHGI|nr:protein GOLM2-like [Aphidius gifuensis]XP_044006864.1 protein GOLM2-like [Aphidius gifuensis]XP_044006865.1 protein GOLM2-like [Aphidius gifuensis]KAF7994198.1 hypothetical protein HCN44_011467 [Aphidius gifuensis]
MGIDGMRVGAGRCPPLVVAVLLLISFLLVCNWWNLSTENAELLYQIDQLHEELKISLDERSRCIILKENFEKQYKHSEDELGALNVRLKQQESEAKTQHDELSVSLDVCKSELQSQQILDAAKTSTLEALRVKKDLLNETLDFKTKEFKKLQIDMDKVKNEFKSLTEKCKNQDIKITNNNTDDVLDNTAKEEEGVGGNNNEEKNELNEKNKEADNLRDPVVDLILDKAEENKNKVS